MCGVGTTYHRETLLIHLARELEVYTSEDGAHLSVNLHRPSDLGDDIDEMTSFEGRVGLGRFGVAVLFCQSCSVTGTKVNLP